MKKQITSITAIAVLATAFIFTGCKKDDVDAPVVTVTGTDMTISLNSTFTDLGATANDEKDGVVTVTTSGSVNTSAAGTYTLTYSATDAAGNTGTAKRTVIVKHTSTTVAASYAVADVVAGSTTNYTDVLTAASGSTVRVNTTKFGNYVNTVAYFDLSGATGSTVTLPSQTITNSGNPAATRMFSGTGTVSAASSAR